MATEISTHRAIHFLIKYGVGWGNFTGGYFTELSPRRCPAGEGGGGCKKVGLKVWATSKRKEFAEIQNLMLSLPSKCDILRQTLNTSAFVPLYGANLLP